MRLSIALVNCYPREYERHWLARLKNLVEAFETHPDRVDVEDVIFHLDDMLSVEAVAELNRMDGTILSGSPLNVTSMDGDMAEKASLVALEAFIRRARQPILGICFGHQLIAHAFGCKIGRYALHGVEPVEQDAMGILHFNPGFDLLQRIPLYQTDILDVSVEWKHQEEVKDGDTFKASFRNFASTRACKLQAMKHVDRPVFGVQFHPETRKDEVLENGRSPMHDGRVILHGFIDVVADCFKNH